MNLEFKKHSDGVWTCEPDEEKAYEDLMEFSLKTPEEQIEFVLEKHERIHFLKTALRILEDHSSEFMKHLTVEMVRLNINLMIHTLAERATESDDKDFQKKVIALSECWHREEDKLFNIITVN